MIWLMSSPSPPFFRFEYVYPQAANTLAVRSRSAASSSTSNTVSVPRKVFDKVVPGFTGATASSTRGR